MAEVARVIDISFTDTDNVIHLHRPNNKKKGVKSEVYPIQPEDVKRIADYLKENKYLSQYLLFVLSCNMARRVGDMLNLRWCNFFHSNGHFRMEAMFSEEKTDKIANPRINKTCRDAIEYYCKETGCDPSENNYGEYVFKQLSGCYAGCVLSQSGYLKTLKRTATALNIEYNIGTHSPRKTFGMYSRMLHPNDVDSMQILQTLYNHSDVSTTTRYIGLTKEKINNYYDDMGEFFDKLLRGEKVSFEAKKPVVTVDTNDIIDIIKIAYSEGQKNANISDSMVHADALSDILKLLNEVIKN